LTHHLRLHMAKFLSKQMIPESFVLLDRFPKMPNGKTDRASLPEPNYADLAKADYVASTTEVQESVSNLHAGTCKLMPNATCCVT